MSIAIAPDGTEFEFGDQDLEDAYCAGDELIRWGSVHALADLYREVEEILDDAERLEAAKALVQDIGPGAVRFGASIDKNLWMHDFPAQAAARGLQIQTYPGWELLSRSSGGFDDILGICLHHTASNAIPANDMYWQWRGSPIKPIGNFSLHRDGTIVLGAAGAANTQGAGGPYQCSKGLVPTDAGNRFMIAIEACNNGVGEVWPDEQLRAYDRLVEVLCDVYGLSVDPDVLLHATWAPTRKIDPAGPTPVFPGWGGISGAKTWNLTEVRRSVLDSGGGIPNMSDFKITNPVRIVDTRTGTSHNPENIRMSPGTTIRVAPHGFTPEGASGVILTVTSLAHAGQGGYLTFWDGNGTIPVGSNVNPSPGAPANNMVWVPLHNGEFSITAGGPAGILVGAIVDQVGWFFQE